MKIRRYAIYIILWMGLLLAGCSSKDTITAEASEAVTALHRNTNTIVRQVGPEGNVAVTSGGMYFAESMTNSEIAEGYRLLYYDVATQKTVAVCSNASCQHNDRSCEAIFALDPEDDGQIKLSPLGIYQDKLYVLESMLDYSMLRLYRSDLSGHNRELVWETEYPSSKEATVSRMIMAESVIWNGSGVYVGYYSENHFLKRTERIEEETGTPIAVWTSYIANMDNGILYIDVENGTEPVKICEESSAYLFTENESDSITEEKLRVLNCGYVCMMAAKDGTVYYRHTYTDMTPDWEAYGEDAASYKEEWNQAFHAQIMKAEVAANQASNEKLADLGYGTGFRSCYYDDKLYYHTQDSLLEYDLETGQVREVMNLNGAKLEDVMDGWVVLRDYDKQVMLLCHMETGEQISKEVSLGCNLYGSIVLNGQVYCFLRDTETQPTGERIYQWYLTEWNDYLTEEEAEKIVVAEYHP